MGKLMDSRAFDVPRSLVFYATFLAGTVFYVLGSLALLAAGSRRFAGFVGHWGHFHLACVRHILGIRVVQRGQLPPGPVLVAVKHESMFEAVDMPRLLDRPGVFAKAELLRIPLWGLAGERFGLIGVERDQGAKALRRMVAAARDILAQGRPLAIFPEGTRVPHGTRPPLQSGFAGLYKLLGVSVVPVAVDSGPLYHRLWKRRGTITILIGEPIEPGLAREDIEARVLAEINRLNPETAP